MMVPVSTFRAQPWRIHDLTPEFTVEDVWDLPTPGGADELPRLVAAFFDADFPQGAPLVVRGLWAARWKLGAVLGWDESGGGLGTRVATLTDRLPADLLGGSTDPGIDILPFSLVYALPAEWAAEMANRTVHAVLHLGWVRDGAGGYSGQMAVLVKPNGLLGAAYMAGIKPLRWLVVYPALLRGLERRWRTHPAHPVDPGSVDGQLK